MVSKLLVVDKASERGIRFYLAALKYSQHRATHGFDRIQTGETTTYNEEAKRGEKKRSIAAITITSAEEERQIKAIFIKYEQNL